jgi:hypothetical protein
VSARISARTPHPGEPTGQSDNSGPPRPDKGPLEELVYCPHDNSDAPCVLLITRDWLNHRTVATEALLRQLGAGRGRCFTRLSPGEWQALVERVIARVTDHPAAALNVLIQARLHRPRPSGSFRTRPHLSVTIPEVVKRALAVRVLLATPPSERARLWSHEVAWLDRDGDAGAAILYPLVTSPSDRDIALVLIACRTGLPVSEALAVRNGDLDPDGLATLAALNDPELGPWTTHLTTSSDERSSAS